MAKCNKHIFYNQGCTTCISWAKQNGKEFQKLFKNITKRIE